MTASQPYEKLAVLDWFCCNPHTSQGDTGYIAAPASPPQMGMTICAVMLALLNSTSQPQTEWCCTEVYA